MCDVIKPFGVCNVSTAVATGVFCLCRRACCCIPVHDYTQLNSICICVCICMYVYTYVCMCICMNVYVCVYVCIQGFVCCGESRNMLKNGGARGPEGD